MSERSTTLVWWRDGEQHLAKALSQLSDAEFAGPSLLPEWTRQRLLAHVARNADALINLLTWARTGIETPMYASAEAREAGIAEAARLAPAALRAEVLAASARLGDAIAIMEDDAWRAEVRTAQGRTVAAGAVLWMRCREVWVHGIDLDAGLGFDDLPADILEALIADVFAMWAGRGVTAAFTVTANDEGTPTRDWGTGSQPVSGSRAAIAAWLTGRSSGADLSSAAVLEPIERWL